MREKRHAARRAARTAVTSKFVVLTGLAGSGKSQAIRALEDLGYFCVDNLPIELLPMLADLTLRAGTEISRAAVVVDIREGRMLDEFPRAYKRLQQKTRLSPVLIFLEADERALVRRFSETRRPHPLSARQTVAESLAEERRLLDPIRRLADQVLDTSALTVHELRRRILEVTSGTSTVAPLLVSLVSFAFRRGLPEDADLVFDVRFLPNPHFVPALRRWSGRNARVSRYVLRAPAAREFLRRTEGLLRFLVPHYIAEGKAYLTIAVGCTGGRHRSVALAQALADRLGPVTGIRLQVRHRDITAEG
jgi:UPF0042 nucleotide-binding protein